MGPVLCKRGTGDQVIVQIREDKWQAAKEAVHQTLECLSRVFQTEGHENILKQAKRGNNGCFGYIFRRHWHLVIALDQVNTGKIAAAC